MSLPTIGDALDAHLSDFELNDRRTSARLLNSYAHFFRHWGKDLPASEVNYAKLLAYSKKRLEEGCKPQTIKNEFVNLRRGLKLLEFADLIPNVPKFPEIRPSKPRKGFFEDEEINRVLAHLPPDVRPLISFLKITGWRFSEGCELRWKNVDWTGQVIYLHPDETKCGEARIFPFGVIPELKALLESQKRIAEDFATRLFGNSPHVFFRHPDSHNREVRMIQQFHCLWDGARDAAGLKGKLIHDLRRTAARRLERAGISRSVSMKLMGHRTDSIFNRYAISNESDLKEGIEKLAKFLGQGPASAPAQPEGEGTMDGTTEREEFFESLHTDFVASGKDFSLDWGEWTGASPRVTYHATLEESLEAAERFAPGITRGRVWINSAESLSDPWALARLELKMDGHEDPLAEVIYRGTGAPEPRAELTLSDDV